MDRRDRVLPIEGEAPHGSRNLPASKNPKNLQRRSQFRFISEAPVKAFRPVSRGSKNKSFVRSYSPSFVAVQFLSHGVDLRIQRI